MNLKYLEQLKNCSLAILGYGMEGRALSNFFYENKIKNVTIFDIRNIENINDFKFIKVSSYKKQELLKYDMVFISPGISPYNNNLVDLNLSSLTNLWFKLYPNAKVIGVSGTKGKSTTSSLIFHTLNVLNKKVALAGNIGIPLLEIPEPENLDFVIVELSSYQLYNFKQNIDSACFLNLYEEHLSWHEGFENYTNDKLNLFRNVTNFIVANYEFKNLFLKFKPTPNYFNIENSNKLPIELSKECTKTLLKLYGFKEKDINKSFDSFPGLKHRLNSVKKLDNNIEVIDDSLSTIPESAIKACLTYKEKDIYLILGGKDRGIDYTKIKSLPKNVIQTFCFDEAGKKMKEILGKRALLYDGFKEAILASVSSSKPNSIILFSPAAPSDAPFKNYKERSDFLLKTLENE